MVTIGIGGKKWSDVVTNCIWKWEGRKQIQKLGSGNFWNNKKLKEGRASEEANDVNSTNHHGAVRLMKNSKWSSTQKSYFKGCLQSFSKPGPCVRKTHMKLLFMWMIFSAGGLIFLRGAVWSQTTFHTEWWASTSGETLAFFQRSWWSSSARDFIPSLQLVLPWAATHVWQRWLREKGN